MRNVLIDGMRKNYKLPSNIDLPTTPFPSNRAKGSKVPGSNFQKASLFTSIPDVPKREKAVLSLPESKVETKLITNFSKQPEQMDKKSLLDGPRLNEDVIFQSFKKLQHKTKAKKSKKKKKETKKSKTGKKANQKNKSNITVRSKHFDVIP